MEATGATDIGGSNGYSRSPNRCGSYLTVNTPLDACIEIIEDVSSV